VANLRRNYSLPELYDPWRRLLAAVVLRAVCDVVAPSQQLAERDRASAQLFLLDRSVEAFMSDTGLWLPWVKIRGLTKHQQRLENSIDITKPD